MRPSPRWSGTPSDGSRSGSWPRRGYRFAPRADAAGTWRPSAAPPLLSRKGYCLAGFPAAGNRPGVAGGTKRTSWPTLMRDIIEHAQKPDLVSASPSRRQRRQCGLVSEYAGTDEDRLAIVGLRRVRGQHPGRAHAISRLSPRWESLRRPRENLQFFGGKAPCPGRNYGFVLNVPQ